MAARHTAAVFHVGAGAKSATEVGKPTLETQYASLTPLALGAATYLLGYHPDAATFDVYTFAPKSRELKLVKAKPHVGKAQDIVNVFILGNRPYVCMYAAAKGIFETYSVADELTFSKKPYQFYRNHELAISHGFTTLKPFTQYGQVSFLGYREDTGYVAIYSVSVAVSSPHDTPPLLMLPVWAHPWAPGWTRFAFFSLGGVPYFLKTNIKALNVNIDHVFDTPANGTAEIGTKLQDQLPDPLTLTNVEAFTLAHGEPYFVTYISGTGAATLNRIHADCLGWTKTADFKAPAGAKVVTPVQDGDQAYLIFA
jgi:hypothetical protein